MVVGGLLVVLGINGEQEAYGEAAFDFIPRSYMLPSQYWIWRSWTQLSASPSDLPWVLKANDHRGRGVRVMRQWQAQRQALRGGGPQAKGDAATQKGFVLVQSYVRRQFLYDNRPSYLRLWVVVTSIHPLRAYLFRGGVLVFGDKLGSSGGGRGGGIGGATTAAAAAAVAATGGAMAAATGSEHGRRQLLQPLLRSPRLEAEEVQGNRIQTPLDKLPLAAAAAAASASAGGTAHGRRRHLEQQQQREAMDRSGGRAARQEPHHVSGKTPHYELHHVNYWTIAGEKLQPWTVGQLRHHAEATWPDDPRVFERAWEHARTSLGMVLASAAGRMRAAARGLAALEGCGFEVLGVDFLLNATFHPTLVELNALPSLARLRTAPGDPAYADAAGAGQAANASASPTTADATAAVAAAPFDLEKERFLHHALRLIGMPIGPPPVAGGDFHRNATSTAAAAAAAGGRGSGGGVTASLPSPPPSVGGVLRALAALLRPPNNDTTELQAFIRQHLPLDMAEAEAVLPRLRPLLCPVPASWGPAPGWPVLETTTAEAATVTAEAAGSAGTARAGRRLAADAGAPEEGEETRSAAEAEAGTLLYAAPEPLAEWQRRWRWLQSWWDRAGQVEGGSQLPRRIAARVGSSVTAAAAGAAAQNLVRRLGSQVEDVDVATATAAKPTTVAAAMATGIGADCGEGVPSSAGHWVSERGRLRTDSPVAMEVRSMPGAANSAESGDGDGNGGRNSRRRMLIHDALSGGAGGGSVASSSSTTAGKQETPQTPCQRRHCYDWDVLAAIADTEYELEQDLDFDPVFPMTAARNLNRAALEAARNGAAAAAAAPTAVGRKSRTKGPLPKAGGGGGGGGGGDSSSDGLIDSQGGDGGAVRPEKSAVLDSNPDSQTGLQRLQTGLGFVRESITAVNLDLVRSFRYMTTTPHVFASTTLPYSFIDAALDAFETVRRRLRQPGMCAAPYGSPPGKELWPLGQFNIARLQESNKDLMHNIIRNIHILEFTPHLYLPCLGRCYLTDNDTP
ncbi:hypothetical protein VOLCADRAFT_93371 [Volvox carteri f. nagariensis]|uniref:Tubulin--tyrosine ligase-like protein 5 n=1 Tax=Volvox carteri f. nagariensis TaxID=3068 RepID=D8U1Y3_VOLCA|nr:uncharacterized protein VOLCADRAFT_93371 [Volvox carteri f. nagariensis]EFJ46264.1 hypothetical protein VOLCADRAFT_93371 [Volvox carteri f. nagariensis]|eukprot:XP_002952711.1 hypothetical protein VOLCADRAFT_93371 [Volvox carteri f. nagariensis]